MYFCVGRILVSIVLTQIMQMWLHKQPTPFSLNISSNQSKYTTSNLLTKGDWLWLNYIFDKFGEEYFDGETEKLTAIWWEYCHTKPWLPNQLKYHSSWTNAGQPSPKYQSSSILWVPPRPFQRAWCRNVSTNSLDKIGRNYIIIK